MGEVAPLESIKMMETPQATELTMAQTKTVSAPITKRAPRTLAGNAPVAADGARAELLTHYEAALRLMQEGKYEKAHAAFDKMLVSAPGDMAERIRMYINACLQQVSKGKTTFTSHEEHYDYAISLLNEGHYEDAREQFKEILKANDKADYAFYGLAVLASMTGDSHTCLEHLTEAIRQNPQNRIQARSDSDFQDMADDPRFTELLYPES
jgi:tetratricopeptide (TPR) repeat protein